MKKPTRTKFIVSSLFGMGLIAIIWSFLWTVQFAGDTVKDFGAFHIVFNIIKL